MSKKLLCLCLMLFTLSIQAQNVKMTGNVVDVDDLPLIGVNVVVKGTTVGTTTDLDGNFVLEGKHGDILVFSYIGMVSQEVEFKGQPLRIVLKDDAEALDEVVVIGYQTVKKSDLTGAVAVVDARCGRQGNEKERGRNHYQSAARSGYRYQCSQHGACRRRCFH